MAKPIAKRLLIHNCILKKNAGLDRNRNPVYSQTVLKRVRIGATFQTTMGTVGEVKADSLTLFIDAVNTQYENTKGETVNAVFPEENDAIEWEGKTFTVKSVSPCYAQSEIVHHWEVTLE